ncbi:major capsid protein [Arthrobacter phage DanielleIgnace]|nr:major capsid protein [Arthrobacter phage DanielleIgnace]
MALWDLEEFQPPNLLPFVRMQPTPAEFQAQRWLPFQTTDDLNFEYIKGSRNRTVMAHVMGFDSEAPIAGRQAGGSRVTGELPPIKRKSRIGEKEIIKFLTPRPGSGEAQAAVNQTYRDMVDLINSIFARVEWLSIKALSEPTVMYDEADVIFEFDFGLNKDFLIDGVTKKNANGDTVPGLGGSWENHATSTPVTDLAQQAQYIRRLTGQYPAEFVIDSDSIEHAKASEELRLLARGENGLPGILTQGEIDSVFARYSIPTLVAYDAFVTREEEDGTLVDEQVLTPGRGFFAPSRPVGNVLWGPTAESRALIGTALQSQAPGIFVNTYNTNEPVAEWIKAAAVAFPTMPNAHVIGQFKVR